MKICEHLNFFPFTTVKCLFSLHDTFEVLRIQLILAILYFISSLYNCNSLVSYMGIERKVLSHF